MYLVSCIRYVMDATHTNGRLQHENDDRMCVGVIGLGAGMCAGNRTGKTPAGKHDYTQQGICGVRVLRSRKYGGKILPHSHIIRTVPMEYSAKDTAASISEVVVPSNNIYRRLVTVAVRPAEGGAMVSARVDVQRRDTTPIRSFAYLRQGDDRPANQPEYATSTLSGEKNEVWTLVKRDYQEEQSILSNVRELVLKHSAKDVSSCHKTAKTPNQPTTSSSKRIITSR